MALKSFKSAGIRPLASAPPVLVMLVLMAMLTRQAAAQRSPAKQPAPHPPAKQQPAQRPAPPPVPTTPPLDPDRPFFATPPGIMGPGYIQVETGFGLEQDETGTRSDRIRRKSLTYPSVLARLGVLPAIEFQLSGEYADNTTTDILGREVGRQQGLRKISIGAKMHIRDEDGPMPQAAVVVRLALPLGHEGLHPVFTAPSFLLLLRNSIGDLKLTYALGGQWNGTDGAGAGTYAVALSTAFTPGARAFAELHGGFTTTMAPAHSLGAGLLYQIGSSVQLDISGGKGITRSAPDSYLSFGISYRFPHLPYWIQ